MSISWTKYIPVEKREEYEKLGWLIKDIRAWPHSAYSYLAIWEGEGDAPLPESEKE